MSMGDKQSVVDTPDLALLRAKAAAFDARREYHRKMNHAAQQAMFEAEREVERLEASQKQTP